MLSDVFRAILCFLDLIVFLLPCTSVSILSTLVACVYVIQQLFHSIIVADSLKADKGSFFNRYCLSCTLVLLLIPKLKFQLQASKFFGSRSRTIWSIKHKKTLHYLCNSLSPRTISVEPEPKFQAPAPPSKSFWLRFQASKIAWAPAAQSLVSCVHHFSSVFS